MVEFLLTLAAIGGVVVGAALICAVVWLALVVKVKR